MLVVHKTTSRSKLPAVASAKVRNGVGAVLTWPDGATDRIVFHRDGLIAAEGRDKTGKPTHRLEATEGK